MNNQENFYRSVIKIALPVTLQSMLQSSFGVVDQLMIGKLGSSSIAGVGLGGKFASLYSVVLGAVAATAGIMISQYIGKRDEKEAGKSFFLNLAFAGGLAVVFAVLCILFPETIMGLYTKDEGTLKIAADYLRIVAYSYLPMAVGTIASVLLRCMDAAVFPLYASLAGVFLNTGMNYLFIFGKLGLPRMGAEGAALATFTSQIAVCLLTVFFLVHRCKKAEQGFAFQKSFDFGVAFWRQYAGILGPILVCEFLWSLGENVYTAIYGNIGTVACAAMTLTIPVQSLTTGMLSGLSQAAGILVGKRLGSGAWERAYQESKKLMMAGLCGSLIFTALVAVFGRYYVCIYDVEPEVQMTARGLLLVYAVIAPVKIQNMILGGGILRSGGATEYIMWIDITGTWLLGVPLGLLSAFVLHLPVTYVYFILSLEECARLGMELVIFRRRKWMKRL